MRHTGRRSLEEYRESNAIWVGSASLRQRNAGLCQAPCDPSGRARAILVAGDERCWDAENAVTGAPQELISVSIEALAPKVDFTIDFDDEPRFAADEVGDATTDDHLTAEGDAEAAAFESGPEALLREGGVVTKVIGLRFELVLAMDDVAWARARG